MNTITNIWNTIAKGFQKRVTDIPNPKVSEFALAENGQRLVDEWS